MENENVNDFTKFLKIITKFKLLIIFGTLFCLLSAIVATIYSKPVYEAKAKLLVSPRQNIQTGYSVGSEAMSLASLSERMVKTYSEMLRSRSMAEKVIEKLNLYESPIGLSGRVEAKPVIDTQLIEVIIKDQSPKSARSVVNAYATILAEEVKDIESSSRKSSGKDKGNDPLITIRLIEPAIEPASPVSPKPAMNVVIALLLGFSVSVGFAFVIDFFDVTFKTSGELRDLLNLPVLGQIPSTEIDADQKIKVITQINPRSIPAEAYAALRTNIQFLNHNKQVRKILITSANPKEGKSTIASNIAVSLAHAGNKVILVDCDLRRPSIDSFFGTDHGAKGLTNYLSGVAKLNEIMTTQEGSGLNVITSGPIPPNPSELLNTEKMKELIEKLEKASDYLIIDSPPILAVTDAAILSPSADAVLLVVSSKSTSRQSALHARTALGDVHANVVGVIFNNVDSKKAGYNHYYYADKEKAQQTAVS